MISKQQADAHEGSKIINTPELLKLLGNAIRQCVRDAIGAGFRHPLNVAVRDSSFNVLRDFVIEASGQIVPGATDDASQLFTLPLTLFIVDARGRIARCAIGATKMIDPTEIVN